MLAGGPIVEATKPQEIPHTPVPQPVPSAEAAS